MYVLLSSLLINTNLDNPYFSRLISFETEINLFFLRKIHLRSSSTSTILLTKYIYIYIEEEGNKTFQFFISEREFNPFNPSRNRYYSKLSPYISRTYTCPPPPPPSAPVLTIIFVPFSRENATSAAYTGRNEPRALWKALIKLTGSLIAAPRISWAFRVPQIPGNGTPRFLLVYNETDKKRSGPP